MEKLGFFTSITLSIAGLVTASIASEVSEAAQPALLYLVPFTILPLITRAYIKVCSNSLRKPLKKTGKFSGH